MGEKKKPAQNRAPTTAAEKHFGLPHLGLLLVIFLTIGSTVSREAFEFLNIDTDTLAYTLCAVAITGLVYSKPLFFIVLILFYVITINLPEGFVRDVMNLEPGALITTLGLLIFIPAIVRTLSRLTEKKTKRKYQ